MSGIDGYLTALVIAPKFIDPRQWIPEQAVQTIVAE
jgi:uncharacterized protein